MRKAVLLIAFFAGAPFLFLFCLVFILLLSYQSNPVQGSDNRLTNRQTTVVYAALPTSQNIFSDTIVQAEAREEMLRQFFTKYDSPLVPFTHDFVTIADKYDLDFRLLPAIAMQETNLCKKAKEGSHNCWGFGVYGGKYTFFDSYPAAIETISKTLSEKYKNKYGLVTPEEIQTLYNPSNTSNWAFAVDHFMDQMQ
jgi:hypothetical protein